MIRFSLAGLLVALVLAFAGVSSHTGPVDARTKTEKTKKKKKVAKRSSRKKKLTKRSSRKKTVRRKSKRRKATRVAKKRKTYRRRAPAAKYNRRTVFFSTKEKRGTIIIDTQAKYLYHVTSRGSATRYGIGVGRQGFGWDGVVKVAAKKKWPSWTPPKEMIEREWKQNRRRVSFMKGGPKNPLGARALYLHHPRGGDTGYRIHGTNEPWSIGLNMSSGCIRMMNKDVEHLYNKVRTGSKVVVIGPNGKNRRKYYSRGVFAALFGG